MSTNRAPFLLIATSLVSVVSVGCVALPTPRVAPQPAAGVSASVGRTWDVVLDQLGERGIAVRSLERASGFVGTQTMAMPALPSDPARFANCGTFASFHFPPSTVEYTILVRGDSTRATVHTTARYVFVKGTGEPPTECVSTGAFETAFDAAVKQRAETHAEPGR
jgi:hypothetical protein